MTSASSSRHFPPNQACLREGEAQHFTDHPHLPLRAWVFSSLPLLSHFLPAFRLQDSDLLKTEESTSSHVFHISFANTALSCLPCLPFISALIHFSSFILRLSCLLSGILASGLWFLTPVLQISRSSCLIASLSLTHSLGVLLGLSLTFDL